MSEKKEQKRYCTLGMPAKLFQRCNTVRLAADDFGYTSVAELVRDATRRHLEMMEAHIEKAKAVSEAVLELSA